MTPRDIVYALAASPNFANDGICFAALESGLYATNDRGISWRSMYGGSRRDSSSQTTAVAASPAFARDGTVLAGVRGGIIVSGDGGASWNAVPLCSPPPLVTSIVCSPAFADDHVALAATLEDGVFRSTDGGRTWEPASTGLLDRRVLCLAATWTGTGIGRALAGTESGVSWSTTGGRSWREIDVLAECGPVLSLAIAPDSERSAVVYVGTETGLIRASVNGNVWTSARAEPVRGGVNGLVASDSPPGGAALALLQTSMFLSLDAGATWSRLPLALSAPAAFTSVVAPLGPEPNAPLIVGMNGHSPRPLFTTVVDHRGRL